MYRSLMLLALFSCLNLFGLEFSDYDSGRDLPSDKVYPQGRIFPFTGYAPHNLDEITESGFTLAGLAYGTRVATLREECAKKGVPLIYIIKPKVNGEDITLKMLSDKDFKPDWASLKAYVAEEVKAASAKYPSIAWWYLTPEELRYWRANEFQYLKEIYQTIHEADSLKRPVWMYIPGHYQLDALFRYTPYQDIIGKGMYVNYSKQTSSRVWVRWSSENQIEALKRDGNSSKFALCVPEMFQDQPDGKMEMIEPRVRHDVYLSLACGSRGVVIFSLARRRTMDNETHRHYFDAYKKIAGELSGESCLGQVFLFGEKRNDIAGKVAAGTPEITIRPIPGRDTEFTYPAVTMTELLYRGARYLVIVNSAETETEYDISKIPAGVSAESIFDRQQLDIANGQIKLNLKPLEAKIIKVELLKK